MSGQQAGSFIGGVIGSYFGPVGYAIGAAIGGAIGGYIDPTIIKGPRLTDATQQTAQDGVPITWGFGTFPTTGNIIWRGELLERKKEDDGKGTGIVNVTYHYYRSYAVGICQGVRQTDGTFLPIEGILQVKKNGKVVYDVQPGVPTEQLAQNTKFLRNVRFYLGSETQDPDSVLESHLGVNNAPAFPGTVYMVVENEEQPDGAIPQWGFVVSVCGTTTEIAGSGTEWLSGLISGANDIKPSLDGLDWTSGTPINSGNLSKNSRLFFGQDGDVLATNAATLDGGVAERVSRSADDGATWAYAGTPPGISADGGDAVYSGNFWHVCRGGSGPIARLDASNNWDAGTNAPDAHCVAITGSGLVAIESGNDAVYTAPNDGSEWTFQQNLLIPTGTSGELGSGPLGEVGYLHTTTGSLGGSGSNNDARYLLFRSDDDGTSFEEVTSPFPDFIDVTNIQDGRIKFDPVLGFWLLSARNRVASGVNLNNLVLSPNVFSGQIFDLESDGTKFVVCGEFGYSATVNGIDFVDLTTDVTGGVFSLAALGHLDGNAIPDAPGWYIGEDGELIGPGGEELDRCKPTLGEIVAEVCYRSGLTAADIDVSELTDEVDGFKVATESTGEAIIGPLMQGWFFDAGEFDDKIRFIKRGGNVVAELTVDDLCESDGDVIEETEIQEAELLRKVHIKTIDPEANFTITTQTAERRTSTVLAKGEQTTEIAVVTDKDTQAQMADKKLKVGWSETRRFSTCLPYTRPEFTVTDLVGLTDKKGRRQRVRLMEMSEDSGRIEIKEAMLDRQSSYTSNVEGVSLVSPIDTAAGLIGPTDFVAMNLPSLRTSDNVPGAYIGAAGFLSGWPGAVIFMSSDDGSTYQQVATFTDPSTMGVLTQNCTDSSEPISVFLRAGSLSSITADQLANRFNGFAITTSGVSELGQFQTATIDSNEIYELTDVLRGQLGTTAASHLSGDHFIMASTAQFLPLDISLAGRTLYFKAVSVGTSIDDATPYPFVFNPLFTSITVSTITVSGENVTVSGQPIYVVTSNA